MGRFDDIRSRIAELIDNRDSEPEPKGFAGDDQPAGTIIGNYLEQNPDKDELQRYWELYENIGPIKSAINNFASEVVEPGWYITADNEETAEELVEFMEQVAITNLENDVNFTELARKMVIEREVRGTVFIEKVTDDQDRQQALYPLQNDTITIYTKAGKSQLPKPNANAPVEPLDVESVDYGEYRIPETGDGQTGAYVQFDDIKPRWDAREEVVYTRDQVMHWPRDADIGDARGTSRIKSIVDRAEGWLQKVNDNDAAIRSKAWPMIIFELGTDENPWTEDQASDFLEHYDDEKLEPGMMQAISGDVSVNEFAGETADIEASLDHDISAMMSGLPGPVFATGGFSQNVAPAVAQAQERQFIKEVKATRRDLENKITPYVREVAEDYGLDAVDSVEFHMGRPAGDVAPEDVSGSIIRYTSDADPANQGAAGAQQQGGQNTTNEGGHSGVNAPQPGPTNQANQANQANDTDQSSFAENSVFRADVRNDNDTAELADPRFVSTTQFESDLSSMVEELLVSARDNALDAFEQNYRDAPVAGSSQFDGVARRAMETTLQDTSIDIDSRSDIEDVIQKTIDTVNQDNHGPSLDIEFGVRHRQRARDLSQNVQNQTRQAAEEMLNDINGQVRRAAQRGESADVIVDRVKDQYSDSELSNRADLITHMELQNAVNMTKLVEYDRSEKVDGIQVINTCDDNTTRLCEHLAGCGVNDGAVAWFDNEQTVSEQLESDVPDSVLFNGFDPLPPAPPFHFGCTSAIVPMVSDNE